MDLTEIIKRCRKRLNGGVVRLSHHGKYRGKVLLSFFTHPFLEKDGKNLPGHTTYFEVWRIAEEFRERGYIVDVIDSSNKTFIPQNDYKFCLDIESNLERLAPYLSKDCIKILFTSSSHWLFNNAAEYQRLNDVFMRRGAIFLPERLLSPNRSITYADYITYGTDFKLSTYNLPENKKTFYIPISTTFTYPEPQKDLSLSRNGFLWLGGAGLVHKGVDLLIEAFAELPHLRLELCGKHDDPYFNEIYKSELSKKNIICHGSLNLGKKEFEEIRNRCAFVISPSCAEGHSGSVIVAMHAGLIPIVNRESGIDTSNFGFSLPNCSVATIKNVVTQCSQTSIEELKFHSLQSWKYVNANHTKETFCSAFKNFVNVIEHKIK